MNPKTSKEILDIMGKKAAPKKGYLNILVGNNVRNIRSNQKMFNKLGKSAPNLLETNNFLINSLEKNHNAHVADWKKYLDTTPMAEWDQKRLKNYDETAKRIRADIKKMKDGKELINHFIDSYAKTKDAVNADYNKALKKERVKTMLTQLGTGGGIGLAGKMVERKFGKQRIDKDAFSLYSDAIEKVAREMVSFP